MNDRVAEKMTSTVALEAALVALGPFLSLDRKVVGEEAVERALGAAALLRGALGLEQGDGGRTSAPEQIVAALDLGGDGGGKILLSVQERIENAVLARGDGRLEVARAAAAAAVEGLRAEIERLADGLATERATIDLLNIAAIRHAQRAEEAHANMMLAAFAAHDLRLAMIRVKAEGDEHASAIAKAALNADTERMKALNGKLEAREIVVREIAAWLRHHRNDITMTGEEAANAVVIAFCNGGDTETGETLGAA